MGGSDAQYDLLTAALIGVALGVSTMLLLSQAGRLRGRPTAMALAKRELRRRMHGTREELEGSMERELRALTRAIRRGRRKLGI